MKIFEELLPLLTRRKFPFLFCREASKSERKKIGIYNFCRCSLYGENFSPYATLQQRQQHLSNDKYSFIEMGRERERRRVAECRVEL